MSTKLMKTFVGICALTMAVVCAAPLWAQSPASKDKPAMYSYVSFWNIPRAQWAEMEKADAADQTILNKAIADGNLIGFGNDVNLVHQPDGSTNDEWWSSMSMAGLINVLEQFYKSGSSVSPVLSSSTKHSDAIFVSHHYNWHPGSWKGLYTHGSMYKLKADAPNDAVDILSNNWIVPRMEKLLADGTIYEYEVDTEAIHNEAPGTFWIFYLAATPEGLDKAAAALQQAVKENPLAGPAFGSMTDFTAHRDYLSRTNATYK